jgi:hypothetical protein
MQPVAKLSIAHAKVGSFERLQSIALKACLPRHIRAEDARVTRSFPNRH